MDGTKAVTKAVLLSAIRRKCMDCSGNVRSEVRDCRIKDCPLYKYRRNALENEGPEGDDEGNKS